MHSGGALAAGLLPSGIGSPALWPGVKLEVLRVAAGASPAAQQARCQQWRGGSDRAELSLQACTLAGLAGRRKCTPARALLPPVLVAVQIDPPSPATKRGPIHGMGRAAAHPKARALTGLYRPRGHTRLDGSEEAPFLPWRCRPIADVRCGLA
jgi:hypothetical protein